MNSDTFLTIVIPCYNEEGNIKKGKIKTIVSYLKSQNYIWEMIIVDDGSIDNSRKLLKEILSRNKNIKLIQNNHAGKANTVITGMMQGKGQYLMFSDLDQATPISELGKFYPYIKRNIDIIIGTRKDYRQGAPLIRAVMGPGFTLMRKLILGLTKISDTQCGFKVFKREVAHAIFTKLKLYKNTHTARESQVTAGFDVEVLFIGLKLGYEVKEIPVRWNYVETRRVNPFKDSLHALIDLVKIRINNIKGKYN